MRRFHHRRTAPLCLVLLGTLACGGSSGADDDDTSGGGSGGTSASAGASGASAAAGSAGASAAAGSAGASAAAGSAGASAAPGGDLLIDDFEDGDGSTLLGGGWYIYTDVDTGGGSTVTIPGASGTDFEMTGEGNGSARSLLVEYSFDKGSLTYDPYIGIGAWLGGAESPLDLSDYAGLSYSYRGAAHVVRLEVSDVADYDFHAVSLPASPNWTAVTLPITSFQQEGWGVQVPMNPAHIGGVSFHIRGTAGQPNRTQIDDLTVTRTIPQAGPDMTVNPPAPPPDGVIASLTIDNPLQEKAQRYLSRGYNITNWLEERRFDGFEYDEEYVSKLALAGFESLRLPIDLDRYVTETSGEGDSLEVTLHEDLYTILDAFDTWTAQHGLSLTIDYHQYDKSIDLAEPESLAIAVAAWGKVAEHFAGHPREDIFFELLNEPELSFGGKPPTQAEWTSLAERMIAAIREHDDSHTIIFGDVTWYGIEPLSRRKPLTDANVIYAFHYYEPFIFTHQGATWAAMGTTHDLPYPYTPERWSEYFADLGFTPFMEPWMLTAARDYYRTGNRSHLRNAVLTAKRWAVQYGVPVICNEFGAYDRVARLEDRARYYTDLVGIFDELEIPWQQWFMVMDAEGNVIPEYRSAFKLGEP